MSGDVDHFETGFSYFNNIAFAQWYVNIDWRSVGGVQPEHLCLLSEPFAEKGVVHVRVHFGTIAVADIVVAETVVDVHVRVHDMGDFQFVVVDVFVKYSLLAPVAHAGIHYDCFVCVRVVDYVGVDGEGTENELFDF